MLEKLRFESIVLITVALVGILMVSSVAFSLSSSVTTISSSGAIVTIQPLHVDGSYIKDSNNNTVVLKGVDVGGFDNCPGGVWEGTDLLTYANWQSNQGLVTATLSTLLSWGCTDVRTFYAAQYWIQNTNNFQTIVYQYAQLLAQRGMYLIFCPYTIWGWFSASGVRQDSYSQEPLPYPPYQLYANDSTIISSQAAYEKMMVSVATTLKNCSNVIIELWNEPQGNSTNGWFSVMQTTINMIRSAGVNNIILASEGYGIWCNLQYPPPTPPTYSGGNPAQTLSWVYEYPLNGSNIAYDAHYYDAFGQNITYSQDVQGLTDCWVPYVLNTLDKPVLFGEIGADQYYTGVALTEELNTFNNTLRILNSWGTGWCAWYFNSAGEYGLLKSYAPSWTPSVAGTIVLDYA